LLVGALFAVVLAALGVYGVMSYAVGLRTREMGIRLALGVSPRRLLGSVMREGLALASAGLVAGLVLAAGLVAVLRSAMPEAPGLAATPVLAGVGMLGLVALVAVWLPARRAARVDPARSLRVD
jgi:ABC-type antimicrobial peptide transport system permease subunit